MPPKQQDMSVRDEDQLARDQSLDQLKDQLRASLGYDGGADGLVSMESGELHRFMGELGDKIAEDKTKEKQTHADVANMESPWMRRGM